MQKFGNIFLENRFGQETIHARLKSYGFEVLLRVRGKTADEGLLISGNSSRCQNFSDGNSGCRAIANWHTIVHHDKLVQLMLGI